MKTVAGTGTSGTSFSATGESTSIPFNNGYSVWVSTDGELYFVDDLSIIRHTTLSTGIVTNYAGGGQDPTASSVTVDTVDFNLLLSIWGNTMGDIFGLEFNPPRLRKCSWFVPYMVTTYAGGTGVNSVTATAPNGDGGAATSATFSNTFFFSGDAYNNFYIADRGNFRIRKINNHTQHTVSTIGGTGISRKFKIENVVGVAATSVDIFEPIGIFVDSTGQIYFTSEMRILKIDHSHKVQLIAGNSLGAFTPGLLAVNTNFTGYFYNLWVASSGVIYFPAPIDKLVLKINTTGHLSVIAGNGNTGSAYTTWGLATTQSFSNPVNVFGDTSGSIFVIDQDLGTVQKIFEEPNFPTSQPSSQPSIPTSQPSSQPSRPTCQPTMVPSAIPTFKPSLRPTSRNLRSGQNITFNSTLSLYGVLESPLSSNVQNAVSFAVAQSMNIETNDVFFVSQSSTPQIVRKLSVGVYAAVVVLRTTVNTRNFAATISSDPDVLYTTLKSKLITSMSNGAFKTALTSAAAQFNASSLSSVGNTTVTVGSYEVVNNGDSEVNSDSQDLSGGVIVGIVLAGVFACVFIVAGVYFCLIRDNEKHDLPEIVVMSAYEKVICDDEELAGKLEMQLDTTEMVTQPSSRETAHHFEQHQDVSEIVMTLTSLRSGDNSHFIPKLRIIPRDQLQFDESDMLGQGSFGKVCKCVYKGCAVAIKIITDNVGSVGVGFAHELRLEALTMQIAAHHGIITFIGAQLEPPLRYIVMERAKCSLFDVLHNTARPEFKSFLGDLTLPLKVTLLVELSETMAYLHSLGIIHRDIKSHNILVSTDGHRLKITDFGLAKYKDALTGTSATHGGKGTPVYMAPEILTADIKPIYSAASDVYAFSILMNEFLSGTLPFAGINVHQIYIQVIILHQRPVLFETNSLNQFPTSVVKLQTIINTGWDLDASIRPSFSVLTHKLNQILANLGGDPRSKLNAEQTDDAQTTLVLSVDFAEVLNSENYDTSLISPKGKSTDVSEPVSSKAVDSQLFIIAEKRIAQLVAAKTVSEVLRIWSSIQAERLASLLHKNAQLVVAMVDSVVKVCDDNDNLLMFQNELFVTHLFDAIQCHCENVTTSSGLVCEKSMTLISKLCGFETSIKTQFDRMLKLLSRFNFCELIIRVMRTHGATSPETALWAFTAVESLATLPEICIKFGDAESVLMYYDLINQYHESNQLVAKEGIKAMPSVSQDAPHNFSVAKWYNLVHLMWELYVTDDIHFSNRCVLFIGCLARNNIVNCEELHAQNASAWLISVFQSNTQLSEDSTDAAFTIDAITHMSVSNNTRDWFNKNNVYEQIGAYLADKAQWEFNDAESLFHTAIDTNSLTLVKSMLRLLPEQLKDCCDENNITPLEKATSTQNTELVEVLINTHASVNKIKFGSTLLIQSQPNQQIFNFMFGAYREQKIRMDDSYFEDGSTLLKFATLNNQEQLKNQLIESGTSIFIPDKDGDSIASLHPESIQHQQFLLKAPTNNPNNYHCLLSIVYLSDQHKSIPTDFFVIIERYDKTTNSSVIHKISLVNRNIAITECTLVKGQNDSDLRRDIFGYMNYSRSLKTRYYVNSKLIDVSAADTIIEQLTFYINANKSNTLCSDFVNILTNVNLYVVEQWSSKPTYMLTVYDLQLIESREERGRVRSDSIDIDSKTINGSVMSATAEQVNADNFQSALNRNDEDRLSLMLLFLNREINGVYNRDGLTAAMKASANIDCKLLALMFDKLRLGTEFSNYVSTHSKTSGMTALHIAVQHKNEEAVRLLLFRGEADPKITEEMGYTPLTLAVSNRHVEIVKLLLHNGANSNISEKMDRTPLNFAMEREDEESQEIVRLLRENGAH